MADEDGAEKNAMGSTWPRAYQIFCIFHHLQALWTWLWKTEHKGWTIKNLYKSCLCSTYFISYTWTNLYDKFNKIGYYSGFYSSLKDKNWANDSYLRSCSGFKYDFLTFIIIEIHFLANNQNDHHLLNFYLSESCKSLNSSKLYRF